MTVGMSCSIGLNAVDPNHYSGWAGPLNACEYDAQDMALICKQQGFQTHTLLTDQATRASVLGAIQQAASTLKSGDIFFLSYSGHGGQVPDTNGDEDDGLDETWCLYDGELIDDELYAALSKFAVGVRIFAMSDSCHSGTVLKSLRLDKSIVEAQPVTYRAMPSQVALNTYLKNKEFYDNLQAQDGLKNAQAQVQASAILISGCQDNQLSGDGTFNGVFTGYVKAVWNGGKFSGDYFAFKKEISSRMPSDQSPNYFTIGTSDPKFAVQKPFTI